MKLKMKGRYLREGFKMDKNEKKNWQKYLISGTVAAGTAGILLYLAGGRGRAIKRDSYAQFGELTVKDVDTTDFVLKHLKPLDRLDPYAITNAVLWAHGIYEGFGGDEKIPEGNWKFF